MSKNKGEYHYAIRALESRLTKIKAKPAKFGKSEDRIKSISAALDCLRLNNLPQAARPLDELLSDDAKAKAAKGLAPNGSPTN